jgi:WD40 repeat protein
MLLFQLWDIRRKGCIFTYKGHALTVNSLKFSPDGQWIASAGEEGLVKVTQQCFQFIIMTVTPWCRMFLEKLIVAQLVRKYPSSFKSEGSTQFSEKLTILSCPEPVYSRSHYTLFLLRSTFILPYKPIYMHVPACALMQ